MYKALYSLTQNILLIIRKRLFKYVFPLVFIFASIGGISILALNSPISAQELANDSSRLLSGDRAIPDLSGLGLE